MYIINPDNIPLTYGQNPVRQTSIQGDILECTFDDGTISFFPIGNQENKYPEYTTPEQILIPVNKADIDTFINSLLTQYV